MLIFMCYVLIYLFGGYRRSNVFGALNLVAVIILFGVKAVLVILLISLFYWLALSLVKNVILNVIVPKPLFVNLSQAVLIGFALLMLFLHKEIFEMAGGVIEPLQSFASLLRVIAFSYVVLRIIDCVRAVYEDEHLLNPLALSGYLVPFFMTPAGPINVYTKHIKMDELELLGPTIPSFIDHTFTIISGYFLKFFVAVIYKELFLGATEHWEIDSILDTYIVFIYIMIEFYGYSLIALGVGRLLGVPTPINFNHPYLAPSLGNFWHRWHMSLGDFSVRNIYNPLLISFMRMFPTRSKVRKHTYNVVALWMPFIFIGLWHSASFGFLLWGITIGCIVASEKLFRDWIYVQRWTVMPVVNKYWKFFGILYTQVLVASTLYIAIKDFPL
jgi:D-alanyl-lipoteichoic acid acyltransferase DltB (MBOAT superfamily)